MVNFIIFIIFIVGLICFIGYLYYKNEIRKVDSEHLKIKSKRATQTSNSYLYIDQQNIVRKQVITTYKTSQNKCVDSFVVVDVETTGLYPETDEIIQLSAIKYINNIELGRFDQYINPKRDIPVNASKINGIYKTDVIDKPTINIILPSFIDFIEDYTLIAHNASFDMKFIQTALNHHKFSILNNSVIDTLGLARSCFFDVDNHKLETLKCYLGIDVKSHNSIEDCHVTGLLYIRCKSIIEQKQKEENQVKRNLKGIEHEKSGELEKAIELYEQNITEGFNGNHPYDRLAIIYRKLKKPEDEIRVLEKAIYVFNIVNEDRGDRLAKLQKFNERLEKIKSKVS